MIDTTQYSKMEISEELNSVVQDAIEEGLKKRKIRNIWKKTSVSVAAFILCMIVLLNVSPSLVASAYDVPIIGDLCRVFTFREYHVDDEIKYIDAKIPQIDNTGKTDLEKRVNLEIQKIISNCLQESEKRAKEYYDAFVQTGGNPEDFRPIGITIDYDVKYIGEQYISFVVSQSETSFSAYNYNFYYNIDLENGKIVTLKDLFGSNYRQMIADSIENTIAGWSEERKAMLWEDLSIIDLISEDTNFYMDENNVIVVIDKYEAASGAAGMLEFTIQRINQ